MTLAALPSSFPPETVPDREPETAQLQVGAQVGLLGVNDTA